MFILVMVIGMLVGKFFVYKFFFCCVFKLCMFFEDGQGFWMVMFLIVFMFFFMMSFIYSEFLLFGGEYFVFYVISYNLGIENQMFMKMVVIGIWLGDFIMVWMVIDMMLQVIDVKVDDLKILYKKKYLQFVFR